MTGRKRCARSAPTSSHAASPCSACPATTPPKSALYRLCDAVSFTRVPSRTSGSLRSVARLYCIGVLGSSVLETASCGTVPGSAKPDGGRVSTRSNGVVSVDRWTCV
ncbi:unnamed protein product [Chondrus crispus]|uniref:Uncharacterized protein n=1 Tax=Chondrus crispus TaxID=2769 RepID=R7Q8X0_CHOCR|nr:unnamed protein product [Chondrus crispus]CDF34258.1 unnamed protein product [Chondrus crispus]|eukprot:XP_005714077.1 unnamed protein product [Chondrus crispus]